MNGRQVALAAAIGLALYSGSRGAGPPPSRNWDVRSWIQPAPVVPPVVIAPIPSPTVPVQPPVVVVPPVVRAPLPPIVAPKPIVKEVKRDKPAKPKPQRQAPVTTESLPSCAQICAHTKGKSWGQLVSEAASYNPSPRLRAHGMACYARCKS